MIDAVAKALARWALPYNEWDALQEEQRERWRTAARVAIGAMYDSTDAMDSASHELTGGAAWRAMINAALTPADG